MLYTCPNSGVINTAYIEFVSPIQVVDPTEENNLQQTIYAFFVRTMSGYSIGFEEIEYDSAVNIRNELLFMMGNQ